MKKNLLTQTVSVAMTITRSYLREGDTAIDATCGNGHDTLALAQAVGRNGRILAIDLQEEAILASKGLLSAHQIDNVDFVQGSFVHLEEHWRAWMENMERGMTAETVDTAETPETPSNPRAIIFNLGYLPGGDKKVTTRTEDTLLAVQQALSIIAPGGIVTLVLYPGHEEGAREREALLEFAKELPASRFHAAYVGFPNQKKNPPEILWITKK